MSQMQKGSFNFMPRLLSRGEAAHYFGIGTTLFDSLVQKGVIPKPKAIGEWRLCWDRYELDKAIDEFPEAGARSRTHNEVSVDPFDDVRT
jgi:predicted DNA-binding transcriptional regulator AlpA